MEKREEVSIPELGMKVYHDSIYDDKESMVIVGIRKDSVELEGDYSGGTHNVCQKEWYSLNGTFRKRTVCEQVVKFGTC